MSLYGSGSLAIVARELGKYILNLVCVCVCVCAGCYVGHVSRVRVRDFICSCEIIPPAVTSLWSSEVLPFCFSWSCSTDISVGFAGLMFKRQQNEAPYDKSVTVTQMVFTNWTLAWELFLQNCHSKLHEYSTHGLVVDVMWQTDWRPAVLCT